MAANAEAAADDDDNKDMKTVKKLETSASFGRNPRNDSLVETLERNWLEEPECQQTIPVTLQQSIRQSIKPLYYSGKLGFIHYYLPMYLRLNAKRQG